MSSTINASTASGGGVITSADASGILQLQTAGVTGLTIDASQNVTLAKGLTVGASAAPAFSAYSSTNQTALASSASVKTVINTEIFDTNNNFDSTTNYRFTPAVAGYYQINASISFTGTLTSAVAKIYVNGAATFNGTYSASVTNTQINSTVSCLVLLNGSTDYIELFGQATTSSGTFTMLGSSTQTYFQAFLARSA